MSTCLRQVLILKTTDKKVRIQDTRYKVSGFTVHEMCTNVACNEHVNDTQIHKEFTSKVQMKQIKSEVFKYTIQLHLKISNLTFIPLGFIVLRELMSLCSAI